MLSRVRLFATPWTVEPGSSALQADSLPFELQGGHIYVCVCVCVCVYEHKTSILSVNIY